MQSKIHSSTPSSPAPFFLPKQGSSVPAKDCDEARAPHISGDADSPYCNTHSDATSSNSDSDYSGCSAGRHAAGSQRNRAAPSGLGTEAVAPSSAAAGAAGVALAALQGQSAATPLLPCFVRCLQQLNRLHLPAHICSTLASAAPGTKLPVRVTFSAHDDDWSPEQYVLSHGPNSSQVLHGSTPAAGAAAAVAASAASAVAAVPATSATLGPFPALAVRYTGTSITMTHVQHGGLLRPYTSVLQPYDVVLYEQVSATAYHLHIQRQQPGAPRAKNASRTISPAGGGMGLQVFPGSIQELDCDVAVARNGPTVRFDLPKVLAISQLPGATFPMDVTVRVVEQNTAGRSTAVNTNTVQQMTARMYMILPGGFYYVQMHHSHPLSALVGRRVVRMQLTPDRQLTLTLEAQPPEVTTAAQPTPHSRRSNNSKTGGAKTAAAAAAAAGAGSKRKRSAINVAPVGGNSTTPPLSTPAAATAGTKQQAGPDLDSAAAASAAAAATSPAPGVGSSRKRLGSIAGWGRAVPATAGAQPKAYGPGSNTRHTAAHTQQQQQP